MNGWVDGFSGNRFTWDFFVNGFTWDLKLFPDSL
jgi:hypothetical protein